MLFYATRCTGEDIKGNIFLSRFTCADQGVASILGNRVPSPMGFPQQDELNHFSCSHRMVITRINVKKRAHIGEKKMLTLR